MKKEYIKIASIPSDKKIVATTTFGGHNYWNFKYPFHHYKEPRFFVATEDAIYEITNK